MRSYIIIGCVIFAALLASCTQPTTTPISQETVGNIDAYFWWNGETQMKFVDTAHPALPVNLTFLNGPNNWLEVSDGVPPNINCIVNEDSIYAFGISSGSVFDLNAGSYFSKLDTEVFDTISPHNVVITDSPSRQIIVGTDSGVYFLNSGNTSFQFGGLQTSDITALAATSSYLYVGTSAGTIFSFYLPLTQNATNWATDPAPVSSNAPITQLLWIGSDSLAAIVSGQNGFYIWDGAKWYQPTYLLTSQVTALGKAQESNASYLLTATSNGTIGAYSLNSLTGTSPVNAGSAKTIHCFSSATSGAFAGTDDGVYQWSGPSSNTWTASPNLTNYKNVTSLGVGDGNAIVFLSNDRYIETGTIGGSPTTLPPTASHAQQVGFISTTPWVLTNRDFDTGFTLSFAASGFTTGVWPADIGGLVLMRNTLFANDSSWRAGTLVTATHSSFPITARVLAHLDSLHVSPPNGITSSYPDVLMVRYSFETPGELPEASDTIPYWIIYYAKNVGPVMFDKVSGSAEVERLEFNP